MNEDNTSDDKISRSPQVVDNSPGHSNLWYIDTSTGSYLRVFEESNSEPSVNNTCANSNLSESVTIGGDVHYFESNSYDSVYNSHNAQELFQLSPMAPPLSINVIGNIEYVPLNTVSTIPCSDISVYETALEEGVLYQREESVIRHFGDWRSSDDNNSNIGQVKRSYNHFMPHHHSSNSQHSSLKYKSAVYTNLTPQTSVGIDHISVRHDNRMGEVATKCNAMGMGTMLPTSPIVYNSKGDYRFGDSSTERGPILLDVPNGRNELVMVAHSTQSIPKLYQIVVLHKESPGIALPPHIPLDLPKMNLTREVTSTDPGGSLRLCSETTVYGFC